MATAADRTQQRTFERCCFSKGQQVALLLCNYIPFLQVLLVAGTVCLPWAPLGWRIGAAVAEVYLLPPVVARLLLLLWPIRERRIAMPSRDYFVWWLVLNLQILFCRLPALEELMRLIPGAYSAWLRLWGARIGSLTYWAAGLKILDRSFLEIGDRVVFGAGVRINPHVVTETEEGRLELLLDSVRIGDRAIIGGYSLLTAGTRIAEDEVIRACLVSPPFSHWKGGRRIEKGSRDHCSRNAEV